MWPPFLTLSTAKPRVLGRAAKLGENAAGLKIVYFVENG